MRAKIINSFTELTPIINKTLVIFGDGRSLKDDMCKVDDLCFDIACIGRSIKLFPNAKHWFNADGETAIAWAKQLKVQHKVLTHTLGWVDGFDFDWEVEQPDYNYQLITGEGSRIHGSSAMFATLAGLELGYNKIILAGCPLDCEGHWYFEPKDPDTYGPLWLGHDFMAWIDFAQTEQAKKVRSLSGFTKQLLGGL